MTVLFLTYPRIGLNRGGLQIQIEETARGLAQLGIDVIFYDPWKNQIPEVDLCHAFSIDGAVLPHLERAVASGKPVVLSPVFSAFAQGACWTSLKVRLAAHLPGTYSDLKRAKRMTELASQIIALNRQEASLIQSVFSSSVKNKLAIIPNGIDLRFAAADPKIFYKKYGVKDFVLAVGAIEPNKNQLTLIRAMKSLNHPLVLIGRTNDLCEDYVARCRKESTGNVLFTGELQHDDPLLASAYAAATLFVLPSLSEVMPLSLYEAALSGCRVAVSDTVPLQTEVEQYVPRFQPLNVQSISRSLASTLEASQDGQLQKAVAAMPRWADVSQRIAKIYEELLGRK